ncbi:MAG: glycosyltransferase family protein [Pseudomonadota bacterium]
MTRIIYGVHGTGHGHAMRALTVARRYPEHEFIFVTHKDGKGVLRNEFPIFECCNPETPVDGHKVSPWAALISNIPVQIQKKQIMTRMGELIEEFKPDAAMVDYEYFVPRMSRKMNLPCLSLDHQHIITHAVHQIPRAQYLDYLATYVAAASMFSLPRDYLIISFYQPPVKPRSRDRIKILPPLLRETVIKRRPSRGEHVLAYHGYTTSPGFFTFLKATGRRVLVYGSHVDREEDNLVFKKNSEDEFLEDLASCKYVICGGGHTLMSEALFLGKPIMSAPIKGAFEQFLNIHYLEKLGYGIAIDAFNPRVELIPKFEADLSFFEDNIAGAVFCGNETIYDHLDRFFKTGRLE